MNPLLVPYKGNPEIGEHIIDRIADRQVAGSGEEQADGAWVRVDILHDERTGIASARNPSALDDDLTGEVLDDRFAAALVCSAVTSSGGVRSLKTLIDLYQLGARRFGIGAVTAETIMAECDALPGSTVKV